MSAVHSTDEMGYTTNSYGALVNVRLCEATNPKLYSTTNTNLITIRVFGSYTKCKVEHVFAVNRNIGT